ncbi:hypothetical protein Dsin_014867 [Dipteronia sinensis]|uniref:Uncharacterized protein n=1 Tax=Dipteronia sinensis TaxID=43782 RepID=A0AAE0EAQ7_9ROSI|nr:hypothetical protein Dsin_014867 [Dipteronia sinensis]
MKKALPFLLLLLVASLFLLSDAETTSLKPRAFESFNVSYIQNLGSCSYSVIITTSCSSSVHTRDHISLSFGDAYGNQIYVPRLDDPSTGTFERCSSDSFQIKGPCAYQICYVYLYRSGSDGWIPDTVKISGYYSRDVSFYYNIYIPGDVWYGFDLCTSASSSQQQSVRRWFTYAILGFVLCVLL